MKLLSCLSIILYILNVCLHITNAAIGHKCDMAFLDECGPNEACYEMEQICKCREQFHQVNNVCVKSENEHSTAKPPSSHTSPSKSARSESRVWWTVIWGGSCLTLALGGALFLLARRYKLLDRLHKLTIRNYNTVLVSSLNDDDAPIT